MAFTVFGFFGQYRLVETLRLRSVYDIRYVDFINERKLRIL